MQASCLLSGSLILYKITLFRSHFLKLYHLQKGCSSLFYTSLPISGSLCFLRTVFAAASRSPRSNHRRPAKPHSIPSSSHHIHHGSSILRAECLQVLRLHSQSHCRLTSEPNLPRYTRSCPHQHGDIDRSRFPHPLANKQSLCEAQSEERSKEISGFLEVRGTY